MHFVLQNYDFIKEHLRLLYATQCDMFRCGVHDRLQIVFLLFYKYAFFSFYNCDFIKQRIRIFYANQCHTSVVVVHDRLHIAVLQFAKYAFLFSQL